MMTKKIHLDSDVYDVLDPVNDLIVQLKEEIAELKDEIQGLEKENGRLQDKVDECD